ncbi:MAG: histidine phosphatase family protein [Chloroflexi bacterium]|nr:histidine phosphatase family protein [Chloroflexota bacterium]
MELALVRHGQTGWNAAGMFRGRADIDLDDTGVRQAGLLAGYLAGEPVTAVYSSPLKRAIGTAAAIAAASKLEVKTAPGLIDFDYGAWQGRSLEELRDTKLYREWLEHPESVRMPGGESLADVRQRALETVNAIVKQTTGLAVLVSHRVVNKVLICALLGLDNSRFWNIRQDNAAISVFEHKEGRYILKRHNDTCHLKSLPNLDTDF